MAEIYLSEAFQSLKELNEEVFDLNAEGTAELKDFVSDNDEAEEVQDIIDPLASTEEELQDSYIGKVILDCSICQSKIYKDPSEVVIDEESDLVNVGDECPYCRSVDGYKVIGEVAPYSKTEVDVEVTPKEDGSEEANIDLTSNKEDEEEIKESVENKNKNTENKKVNKSKQLKENLDLESIFEIIGEGSVDAGYDELDSIIRKLLKKYKTYDSCYNALVDTLTKLYDLDQKDAEMISEYQLMHYDDELEESLSESINNINIDTDKETINVTATEKQEEGEEMIAPVAPETEEEFEKPEEVEGSKDGYQDIDIDEFDEEEFDELGESYLKNVYENVKAYKTTSGSISGNQLKLEGIITFKSGKQAKTNFMFEAKTITKSGKLKFFGENKQFAKGNKSFTLTGRADKNKLIAESLTYNYKAKDSKTGNSKRLYGTVKR